MRFDELDLEDEILDGLEDMNFHEMTPVQEHTIPVILEGRDIIGCAQTGTGKTAAYTLPLLNKLLIEGNPDNVVKSLIIVPTRELAQQIDQQFQGFSYYAPLSTTVVYGGGDGKGWDIQKNGMLNGADVVIATPGRMIAHLQNSGVDLSHVEYLILDEADRMLDMGFSDDIMKIISYMPAERQTIMFSATLPPKIRELAKTILRNPAEVNIAISKPNEAIDQSAYICYERQKLGIIRELFAEPTDSKTIIFSSSKLKVKELAHTLKRMGLDVAAMHSDLEQAQREEVMLNFKNNKVKILVATDIVARGIDIEDIGLVLNYDVPHDPEDYIHRIGRTARAAASGAAMTFVSEEEQGKFHQIEKFIERDIRKAELPESVGEGPKYAPDENRGRFGRGRGERSGEGVPVRAADAADGATVRVVTTGTAAANARRLRLRLRLRNLPRHNPLRRTATTLRAVAKATAGPATAAVTAEAAIGAAATSRRAANRRRRHKYQKFPSNQRREFLFTSVLPGVITYANVPPSGAYAISLPEGGLGWGRIYLLSHAGCAGSSAVRASARLMPSARATPSPYDGSAL
ncbi:MAG: DEAD/DEAH box helicase [Alistipes shahii]